MAQAIVMAGGRSERMRACGISMHKALLDVGGSPLLERNVTALLDRGVRRMSIAVSAFETQLLEYCRTTLRSLVVAAGGSLELIVENEPLGTIGAAREAFSDTSEPLLVINADNITSLDFRALLEDHRASQCAMTIASHMQQFIVPFGEICEENSYLKAYREKPAIDVQVSSGTYVLSDSAVRFIEPNEKIGVDTLVARLLSNGERVRVFKHDAKWFDVNDTATLEQARAVFGNAGRSIA